MTRLFYIVLYSAIAALAIALWKRHDPGELLDLVGARHANAQSPDPALPGAFDPAANGGMNNPNGFNNFNPANPAAQLLNSNSQQAPSTQVISKDATRPAAWPSTQAVNWGNQPQKASQPIPGADGLPGVSLTQYQEAIDPSSKPAAAPLDPNVRVGMQYPNPTQPNPTMSNYSAANYSAPAAAPPNYPATGAPSAPPYAVPPGNAPARYPAAAPPPGYRPTNYSPTSYPPAGNAPPGYPPPANVPLNSTPVAYPPAAVAPPGNAPVDYRLPTNAPPANAPAAGTPAANSPPAAAPPGSAAPGVVQPPAAAGQPATAEIDYGKPLPGTRIIARVGTEFILEADLLGPVNDLIARNKERIPKDQVERVRDELMKQRLGQLIQTKTILCDCRAKVPAEGFKKFGEKLGQHFDEEEVPKAMEKEGCKSRFELDEKMRANGGSLEREKAAYVERQMAMGWIHEQAKSDKEVTHEQMLDYYYQHIKDYEYQSKVRWEQLQVRFKNVQAKGNSASMVLLERDPTTGQMRLKSDPSKLAAWRTIADAGNRVVRGEPFADVAKAISDGPTANKGGAHDWTNQGSLSSEDVDKFLFTGPVGQLSKIFEDGRGFQIVRVVERKMAGREPFTEVQHEIKKRIKEERNAEAMRKYVSGLQDRVSIWTIYDGKPMEELEPVKSKDDDTPVSDSPAKSSGNQAPWTKAARPAYP